MAVCHAVILTSSNTVAVRAQDPSECQVAPLVDDVASHNCLVACGAVPSSAALLTTVIRYCWEGGRALCCCSVLLLFMHAGVLPQGPEAAECAVGQDGAGKDCRLWDQQVR